ncbi:MAG: ATP-dependent RecD-like DNA helicase [Lentisphaerae bacterium]|nr:ATP-dependent RecD-like DNA helicase [Lentisphaerota bacterium]
MYKKDDWQRQKKKAPEPNKDVQGKHQIIGIVENIVFRSEETGYTVCTVKSPDMDSPITVVGNCPALWIGETLEATGEWVRHQRHGYQFQASVITCIPPTSAKGIERYLASGMIRGIGKVNAQRLVQAFGKDTLRIIEKESKRLEEIEGIGPIRRQRIKESWIEQKGVRDIMIFLQGHGIGNAQSARIYRYYGSDAINIIRENPYRLAGEIWGIGFKTADEVAISIGMPMNSELRARAGLEHILRTMTEEGHCFCSEPELLLHAEALLEIPVETLTSALKYELDMGYLINDMNKIYLAPIHAAEVGIANKINELLTTPCSFKPIVADKAVPWAEQRMNISFAPKQAEALAMALSEKVSIMTGGPGVGKTTIIRALVDIFGARKLTVSLAAPTGRAAKRMEEATLHEAKTIHRMLRFIPKLGRFEHGPGNLLKSDVFILDEVSMIDVRLMYDFLSALPGEACLVLVGDTDQLPSVGPGNVLRDLIASDSIPCMKLDMIFRQETGGLIVRNAHRINNGGRLEISNDDKSDFFFIESQNPDQVIANMLNLVTDRIPKKFGFNPMTDVQVLTPMRKNMLGADNLNAILQNALNPTGECIERFGRKYRIGDRVMQIRNNYDKDIFNGDIGLISTADQTDQELTVDFDGRRIKYDFSDLDELVHAYACSIHKSQGSEYPSVVILLATQHYKLLQRNLLYTALTRGRKLACLVGSTKAVQMAIGNNEIRLRRTGLQARLRGDSHIEYDTIDQQHE